jgi:hypothetical protein
MTQHNNLIYGESSSVCLNQLMLGLNGTPDRLNGWPDDGTYGIGGVRAIGEWRQIMGF